MGSFYENEQRIAANRKRLIANPGVLKVRCPGCEIMVTPWTAGGYRTFCQQCVEVFPPIPTDGGGYSIQGQYPEFQWLRESD